MVPVWVKKVRREGRAGIAGEGHDEVAGVEGATLRACRESVAVASGFGGGRFERGSSSLCLVLDEVGAIVGVLGGSLECVLGADLT